MVDLLSDCVQENTPESPPIIKLEESLLDSTKVDKVDTLAKSFKEALGKIFIPTNEDHVVSFMKGGKSKNHKARLGPNKKVSKEKKKM